MYAFEYHKPRSLAEAVSILAEKPEARVLAGGMTLIPALKQRLASPGDLVDLSAVGDLIGIAANETELIIGSMTTHAEVAQSDIVLSRIPALAALAEGIGDPQVRHRGTVGGSISNADPAADYPAALVGLGASIDTDRRSIEADAFFTGMFETALEPGEIVRQVRFPIPRAAGYAKYPNPASRYAVVGVFVARMRDEVRVAVTGAAPSVFRAPEMELPLTVDFSEQAIAEIRLAADDLNSDPHATSAYRAHLITVMARRAVAAAKRLLNEEQ